ncbi:MAG TPA: glutathione peroxidase [Methylophilaceae bacterium]|jgi:glutathione peroxidase
MKYTILALFSLMLPWFANAGECPALLNHQFSTLQGGKLDLCQYRDNTILVVNTASKCGFTPQFDKLEKLYSQYKEKGLLIVGFPSNDFRQEYASNKEIGSFCKLTYGVKFPMVESSSVVGKNANPFYKQLKSATGQEPLWNFHKFLITEHGTKVQSFPTPTEPDDPEIMNQLIPTLK